MTLTSEPTVDRDRVEAICPLCQRQLTDAGATIGHCELHGWVHIDFGHPLIEPDEEAP